MGEKSLGPDANEAVRLLVQEIVDREFEGNRAAAARAIGVSQSFVQELLAGRRGAGNKLLRKLSEYTGRTLDELSGVAPRDAAGARGLVPASALGAREQWSAVRRELESRMVYVQPEALAAALDQVAASSMSARPKELTADWVQPFVEAYLKVNAHELRSENERIRAEMAADDAKGRR